ncbi:hypothetical protein SJS80_20180, partial [Aeromonas caviae]|uniref:hypothetical protein n=1 Tax=Aeromonas caviae TaxID=648 RepID=UPI0029DB5FC3
NLMMKMGRYYKLFVQIELSPDTSHLAPTSSNLHPALLADPFKVEFHSLPEYRMKHLRHRWARY